jgi:hypothetical protein
MVRTTMAAMEVRLAERARVVEHRLPPSVRPAAKRALVSARQLVDRRPVRWGSLRRYTPIGKWWGASRGVPVDRHYIDAFIRSNGPWITGDVLEVKEDLYASRFGHALSSVDILDIDPTNPKATVLADLGVPGALATEAYDCIIVTQTLQFVERLDVAVGSLWAALRPGGRLLISLPCVSRLEPSLAHVECWRVLPAGLRRVLERLCPGAEVSVEGRGNQVAAIAFLAALGVRDLRADELDHDDPGCPLITLGSATKPLSDSSVEHDPTGEARARQRQ